MAQDRADAARPAGARWGAPVSRTTVVIELVSTCLIGTVIVIFDVLIVTRHGLVTLIDQENRPNLVVICCRFGHLDRDRDKLCDITTSRSQITITVPIKHVETSSRSS